MSEYHNLDEIISQGESLETEFKSDKQILSDKEIYEVVIGLANTKGGRLFIGIENNGEKTGLNPTRFKDERWFDRIRFAIRNNTTPSIDVKCEYIRGDNYFVINVPKAKGDLHYSKKGVCYHRVLKFDGPENVPMQPHQVISKLGSLGNHDFSNQEFQDASFNDLDIVEFARLKNLIQKRSPTDPLLTLSDEEIAKGLEFVKTDENGNLKPTLTGILLVGKEASIQKFVPTHELAFQVIDEDLNPKVNKFFKKPILALLEEISSLFNGYNQEKEISLGFQRISIPNYSPNAFREAVLNALVHRDYAINQSIYIKFEPEQLKITNPGGFIEGITLENFITHEPKPRNRQLAEVCQRIGLVERIGRGIDKIFLEQLRFGRRAPDYSSTDNETVRVVLPGCESNLNFVKFVVEKNIINVYELLILSTLQDQKNLNLKEVSKLIQNTQAATKKILYDLISKNFIVIKKGKDYMLSPWVYKQLKKLDEYIHLSGFDSIQQETMILQYIAENGSITRQSIEALCNIPKQTAIRRIKKLIGEGKIDAVSNGRSRKYCLKSNKYDT